MVYQLLSVAGAILILTAYAAHQWGHMATEGAPYQTLNMIGGLMLCITAISARQYGFIMLEGCWTLVSAGALWKVTRGRQASA